MYLDESKMYTIHVLIEHKYYAFIIILCLNKYAKDENSHWVRVDTKYAY